MADKRTKAGKAFLAMLDVFIKDTKGIEIVSSDFNISEPESPYNPEFVRMVKESAASKERIKVDDVDDLWESL